MISVIERNNGKVVAFSESLTEVSNMVAELPEAPKQVSNVVAEFPETPK